MDNLALLRTFVVVARLGSMADAAVELGYTGPAVSQQIARLERELDVTLFERHRHGVLLTAAGTALMAEGAQLLGLAASLEAAVRAADAADHVRLESFSSASVNVLPDAISVFRSAFPSALLSLVETADDIAPFNRLLAGDVDLAIVHEYDHVPLELPGDLRAQIIGRDDIDVILPPSHPLIAKSVISLADLRNDDWVLFANNNTATLSMRRATAAFGYTPRSSFEAADYQVVLALVGAGVGVSLMPRMITTSLSVVTAKARTKRHCVVRPLRQRLCRVVSLVTRHGEPTPALAAMSEAVAAAFRRSVGS